MKNKEEMEKLLSNHGGTFKTDFGLNETMNFGDKNNGQGWNKLLDFVQGKVQDDRMQQTIIDIKAQRDQKYIMEKKKNNVKHKVSRRPESITDVTRAFLSNVKGAKGKKKKIKAININKSLKKSNLRK